MDIGAYLRRINYRGPQAPGEAVLRALHIAHLEAVPFENLDIHLGRPIVLTSGEAQYRKIVHERRGGFCYELNGAFAALLRTVGFGVSLRSAGVMGADGRFGPPFDHLTLDVVCPGSPARWLVDVGVGDGFLDPLRLAVGLEQEQENGVYRLEEAGGESVLWRRTKARGEFEAQYRFSPEPHELADFAGMCRYHQTSPDSHFTRQRVCSLATPDGRITLRDDRLIVTRHGERSEQPVPDDAAYRAVLLERFGIELTGAWAR
jgi:N-hydroxyarylamine O-acetyltransferase